MKLPYTVRPLLHVVQYHLYWLEVDLQGCRKRYISQPSNMRSFLGDTKDKSWALPRLLLSEINISVTKKLSKDSCSYDTLNTCGLNS